MFSRKVALSIDANIPELKFKSYIYDAIASHCELYC